MLNKRGRVMRVCMYMRMCARAYAYVCPSPWANARWSCVRTLVPVMRTRANAGRGVNATHAYKSLCALCVHTLQQCAGAWVQYGV